MLASNGKLKGDLTVFNWGDGKWWIMGSYYLRQWHMRWFEQHLRPGVNVRDISDDVVGLALAGPHARKVLEKLTDSNVSREAFGFMACRSMDVGLIRAKVGRLSVVGELGYEIHCQAAEHAVLRKALLEAGKEFGISEFGFNALNSLRLEKSFGIWSREFTQGYTANETLMDRWVDFDKPTFIGRDAAVREREAGGSSRTLVTLEIEEAGADALGYEPIRDGKELVGFVTSGGYGYTLNKSLAMGLLDKRYAQPGTSLKTHIVGVERTATVLAASPYDTTGSRLRM
jgi:dimethylglycine dehydrogenase